MRFTLAILWALILPAAHHAASFDKGGILGVGARAFGLGGASVAQGDDASVMFWNPALSFGLEHYELLGAYGSILGGKSADMALGARANLQDLGLSLGFGFRSVASSGGLGFGEQTTLLSAAFPFTKDKSLAFGANLKIYSSQLNIPGGEASGYGVDFGFAWRGEGIFKPLRLGLAITDFQSDLTWATGLSLDPPQSMQLGAAWYFDENTLAEIDSEVVTDALSSRNTQGFRVGAERSFDVPAWDAPRLASLRVGYFQSDSLAPTSLGGLFTMGLGLQYKGARLDYAYTQDVSALGESHRISGSWNFDPETWGGESTGKLKKTPTPRPTASVTPDSGARLSMSLRSEPASFNPSRKGESVALKVQLEGNRSSVVRVRLRIEDEVGVAILELEREGLPETLRWDGKTRGGIFAPSGNYKAILEALDDSGKSLAQAEGVMVLAGGEDLTVSAENELFSPSAGSRRPQALFNTSFGGSGLRSWTLVITARGSATALSTQKGKVLPKLLRWDGRDSKNKLLPDGPYLATLRVALSDASTRSAQAPIEIDTRKPDLKIEAYPRVFEPGDAAKPVGFKLATEKMAGIPQRWELLIETLAGKRVRLLEGRGLPDDKISWNGVDDSGKAVARETLYRVTFALEMESGALARSPRQVLVSEVTAFKAESAIKITLASVRFGASEEALALDEYRALKEAADGVKKYGNEYLIQVLGYCDDQEASKGALSDLELSYIRAREVKDYLVERGGLDLSRVKALGYGSDRPTADNGNEEGRSRNRRVEVILYTQ